MRAALRWLVVPVLLTGVAVATLLLLDRGLTPSLIIAIVGISAAVVVLALERALPYAQAWRQSRADVGTDALHLVVSGFAVESFPSLIPVPGLGLWPGSWPLAAQLALALVVVELLLYWTHRINHEWRPLWRVHAVHHSAPRLYWLNTTRTHPVEAIINITAVMLPLVALGAGPAVLTLFAVFGSTFRLIQHSNIDVRCGALNWVFSLPEVHRWHHSRRVDEANANYGAILLIWDIVFRTRKVPTDRAPPLDVGLADLPGFPTGYLGQLAAPFSPALWRR